VAVVVLSFTAQVSGFIGKASSWLRWGAIAAVIYLGVPLLYRYLRSNVLWRLRNKLALTYILIGLSPVVLFFLLVCLSSYVAAGQFAIHLAVTRLISHLEELALENGAVSHHLASMIREGADLSNLVMPELELREMDVHDPTSSQLRRQTAAFLDNKPLPLVKIIGNARSPLPLPDWFAHGNISAKHAIVIDGQSVYLTAINRRDAGNGHTITLISSVLIDRQLMTLVASGLGSAGLVPTLSEDERPVSSTTKGQQAFGDRTLSNDEINRVSGGSEPPPANALDVRVGFVSALPVMHLDSGTPASIPIRVESRPSVLYQQLFGSSLSGLKNYVRISFIVICVLFALIEALALYMAMRLSRTITQSVEDLYAATLSIDQGDLSHRIKVHRVDQLADLSHSFNRMTWSLQRLLEEQKEKERMQNELSIAQEVQENLFPLASVQIPTLELHGVCRPARSVSGDYYDFLVFHNDSVSQTRATGLGIALGDISGKGISAALLMAMLHSAVRAYRFASEELVFSESSLAALMAARGEDALSDCGEIFESPGRIMSLLNRHLYRSTQPEKYATLFLAHYDAASSRLTYSTAGQLPPFVLKTDGTLLRLDLGGTVVGLMDGMRYDEGCITLESGDILIAYSDGVTEPENDFGDFGEERLIDVVRQHRHLPLEVISSEVLQALDAWIGNEEQPDDITLVLARQI